MAAGTSSKFRINWVAGVISNTTYRVRAAWNDGSTWSPYGSFCTVTTPASAIIISGDDELEEETFALKKLEQTIQVKTYPNPFTNSFFINVDGLTQESSEVIALTIYDMQGRLMDRKFLRIDEIASHHFGQNYNKGTYIVRLNNAGKVLQRRVVKVN